jgi:hypothetical protein
MSPSKSTAITPTEIRTVFRRIIMVSLSFLATQSRFIQCAFGLATSS